MFKIKKNKLFLSFSLLFFLLGAGFVSALEIDYPALPFPVGLTPGDTLTSYFYYLFYLIFWLGIGLTAVIFVIGAFRFIFFSPSAQGKASAREQMTSAFFGLLILISSVLILKTINPDIIILQIPEIPKFPVVEIEQSEPTPEEPKTLITVELPLGTIIEKIIFETASSRPPEPPRMERIKLAAGPMQSIAEKISEQSEELKILVLEADEKCACKYTTPADSYCSCDPCKEVRQKIQKLETENLKKMGVVIKDEQGNDIDPYKINLISTQEKTIEELRFLKEETNKLLRTEQFMLEYGLNSLDSLSEYLSGKEWMENNGWLLLDVKFWKEILIDKSNDYATFYCPVSGNIFGSFYDISIAPPADMPEPPGGLEKPFCEEIPVGKIIDRAEKISGALIARLELLIDLNKQIAQAVDHFHYLISLCTSRNCNPPSSGSSNSNECEGEPCPVQKIIDQFNKIKNISGRITEAISEPTPLPEKIGIVPLIEGFVPPLIEDLKKIKKGMADCVTDIPIETLLEEPGQPIVMFLPCENVIRSSTAGGETISECHSFLEELSKKAFKECLSECWLVKSNQNHKICLSNCLKRKTGLEIGETKNWFHSMDFFCCGK